MKQSSPDWSLNEIGYCANVHSISSLEEVIEVIKNEFVSVCRLCAQTEIGSGLWLSDNVVRELNSSESNLNRLIDSLRSSSVNLVTLNGFPFGDFHQDVVKSEVYLPDWSEQTRLDYTVALARLLAQSLASDTQVGTISTVPLGYKGFWNDSRHLKSKENLVRLVSELSGLHAKTGKKILVCLEMEPGCVLERSEQLPKYFAELEVMAKQVGIAPQTLYEYLGVCFDVCHQAVMFEDITTSLNNISDAGIRIGKIQISNALSARNVTDPSTRDFLKTFCEPKYLHQVSCVKDGETYFHEDLGDAIADEGFPTDLEWRIHYHIPIQLSDLVVDNMGTTQGAIIETLDWLSNTKNLLMTPHLEVETYTWHVLPDPYKPTNKTGLQQGLADELNWLKQQLIDRELLLGITSG